jgi:ferritin-like metal-binding protein YciE
VEFATLEKLYVDELKDLYSAEHQILKALPKMIEAATSKELRAGFEVHLKQTEQQVKRLDKIFDRMGKAPTGKKCHGMEGLLEEGAELLKADAESAVLDAGMISAAQRVEHYEIAGYGTVRTYAELLKQSGDAKLLQDTLNEEKETNEKLTKLATKINVAALEPAISR